MPIERLRLFDRIGLPVRVPPEVYLRPRARVIAEELQQRLPEMEVVAADNVAEYYYHHVQEQWNIETDFPTLAPPFPAFFIEMNLPKQIRLNDGTFVSSASLGHPPQAGGAFLAHDLRENSRPNLLVPDTSLRFAHQLPGARWLLEVFIYQASPKLGDGALGPIGANVLVLSEAGTPLRINEEGATLNYSLSVENSGDDAFHMMIPMLMALSFLNCKNVNLGEGISHVPSLKKLAQKHKKKGVRFHVLEIEPMKEVLRREGRSGELGIKKALHICRGHFATYGIEGRGKLFGRHSGTFWVPSHLRGSAKQGAVVKDYRVQPPRKEL